MAVLIAVLLTIGWLIAMIMAERDSKKLSHLKLDSGSLNNQTIRRFVIRPMCLFLERSGIQDRMQSFIASLHNKLYVLHGVGWSVEATRQFVAFTLGCGYLTAISGAWLSVLSSERLVLYLGLMLGVVIPIAKWRDTSKRLDRRKQDILLIIPEVLSKLMLLLGAGETLQRALSRCTERKGIGEENPFIIELRRANEEVRNGESFTAAMEAFSRRCAVQEVSLFTTTVLLNYRKGGDRLVLSLKELSYSLWEKRKAVARSKGEEASTKLVFPLVGIFFILMALVASPAILMMGG